MTAPSSTALALVPEKAPKVTQAQINARPDGVEPGIWTAILQWSIDQHDPDRDPNEIKPLSEEDKKFLQGALDTLVVDENKRMTIIRDALRVPEDVAALRAAKDTAHTSIQNLEVYTSLEARAQMTEAQTLSAWPEKDSDLRELVVSKKVGALDELEELTCRIDNALTFIKLNGLSALEACLTSEHEQVVVKALAALGTIVQNNEVAQDAALAKGLLSVVVKMIAPTADADAAPVSNAVLVKAVYFLGSLIRGHTASVNAVVEGRYMDSFYALLLAKNLEEGKDSKRALVKLVSLVAHIWSHPELSADTVETLLSDASTVIPTLASMIGCADVNLREHAGDALVAAVQEGKHAANGVVLKKVDSIKKVIQDRLNVINAEEYPEDYDQERDALVTLQKLVNRS